MKRSRRCKGFLSLQSLFISAVILSIICSLYCPAYSQMGQSDQYERLVEQIRNDVKLHIEHYSEPLKAGEILEYYSSDAESIGLTRSGLKQLYFDIYQEQKNEPTGEPSLDILRWITPSMSWLIGIISFVSIAIITNLRNLIDNVLGKTIEGTYERLAGTYFFRTVALKKYQKSLIENYDELNMPFLQDELELNISNVYVPLNLKIFTDPSSPETSQILDQQESLDTLKTIAENRRVIILGKPGSGKSVLLKHLACSYGQGRLDIFPRHQRPILVYLELSRVTEFDQEKLIQELVEVFKRNQFPEARNRVEQELKSGNLMLLLDGLDEVNSDNRSKVTLIIRDLLQTYNDCRAIITCRTAVYDNELSSVVDKKLEVMEFNDRQIQQFLQGLENQIPTDRVSVKQIIRNLKKNPKILGLARNPLMLTIVSHLYTRSGFDLPGSRAEFFSRSTDILLNQKGFKSEPNLPRMTTNRYPPDKKRQVLQHLALYIQDHPNDLEDRRSRSISAKNALTQVKRALPNLNVEEVEAQGILDEITERSGLLLRVSGQQSYIFPHQTIQEYFAAEMINEGDLINKYQQNPTAWQEVIKLWCSSKLDHDSTSLIKAIYSLGEEQDINLSKSKLFAFECLAEAKRIDEVLANQIIEYFEQKLNEFQYDENLAEAFGAVAASGGKRGQKLLDFLKDMLFDAEASPIYQRFAASALSRTNLEEAANVLIKWYQDSEPIIRMGDLAIPGLEEFVRSTNTEERLRALKDLYAIGTPAAAIALVPLLGNDNLEVSSHAAWYLAALFSKSDILEELRNYEKLDSEQKKKFNEYYWVWEPFREPPTSALPAIAGGIYYMLKQRRLSLSPNLEGTDLILDPRLVVPVCAISLKPNSLPESFPPDAEALLEQPIDTPEIREKCKSKVEELLSEQPTRDQQWKSLLLRLDPKVQLDLLKRLINLNKSNKKNNPLSEYWRDLSKKVDFEFKESFHYKFILIIAFCLSASAILKLGIEALTHYGSISVLSSFDFITTSIIVFFLSLRQSSCQDNLNFNFLRASPDFFKELGPLGMMTFRLQISQVVSSNLSWSGIKIIYNALTLNDAKIRIGTVILAIVGVFLVVGVGTSDNPLAVSIAVISTFVVTFAFAVSGAGIVTGAFDIAFTVAVIGAFFFALALAFAIAEGIAPIVPGALAGAFTGALAGVALGAWHELQSTPEKKRLKFLAIFAFPWFLWFPNVLIINIWTMYDILSTYNIPLMAGEVLLPQAVFTVLIIVGLGGVFWWLGYRQDIKARNPFHGGELERVLLNNGPDTFLDKR